MNLDQLRTVLWLRWRLTRNQWSRGGQVNMVITMIALTLGLLLAAGGGVAGVLVGFLTLDAVSSSVLMLVWDGLVGLFLMFWTIGVTTELQRSEMIDLPRLLHLPVSLREVFLLNYVASHLSFGLALALPAMTGLALGLVIGRGPKMVLLLPLVAGFFFMITAWTYCLRGWLASLMVNQRRRRTIIMLLTLVVVMVGQLPNLLFNVWRVGSPNDKRTPAAVLERKKQLQTAGMIAHRAVPVLWLPQGARMLAEGQVLPAILGAVGMIGIGALGLHRAYSSTLTFYRGTTTSKPSKPKATQSAPRPSGAVRTLLDRRLPFIPEDAAATALATFRSMSRAPEVRMALAMNVFIFVFMGIAVFAKSRQSLPEFAAPLIGGGAVMLAFFGLIQILFNQFGFDRDGFRALVLLPARRDHLLLGKNLATFPLAFGVFGILLALFAVGGKLPLAVIMASLLQFTAAFLILSTVGNLTSVYVPYRISAGSMKPTKIKASTSVMLMLVHLLYPVAMVPVLLPAILATLCASQNWMPPAPVNLGLSILVAVAAGAIYVAALKPAGNLLQRRERAILEAVTQEVE